MNTKPTYKSYIICTSPRSGSTLLCKLLGATGMAGNPNSHLHRPSLVKWLEAYDLSGDDYASELDALRAVFAAAMERGRGGTPLFGLRLQQASFDFFIKQTGKLYPQAETDGARIEAAFGPTLIIYLTRLNKLDQAVSHLRAAQTGLWHRNADGSELERLAPPQEPFYDASEIHRHLQEQDAMEEAWQAWFKAENIQPHRLTYEDLSQNPQHHLANILDKLGLDSTIAQTIAPPTAKLADELSEDWVERFRDEEGIREQKKQKDILWP